MGYVSFRVRASRDLGWLGARIGIHHFTPGARAIETVDKSGRVVGMIGYDGFTQNSAQIHIALDTPLAWRALSKPAFWYPFHELGLGLLLAMVSSANTRSLELTEHVGFRPTYRIEDGILPGTHIVLFEMRREDCRWLEV